jgi:multidrug transporter EmrE-like cation transporter
MRSIFDFGLLIGYTIGTVGGLLLLKYSLPGLQAGISGGEWHIQSLVSAAIGCVFYVAGAAVWMVIMARNDLSVAYPIAVGATVITTTLAGTALLGEATSLLRTVGCGLVILGVALVARG